MSHIEEPSDVSNRDTPIAPTAQDTHKALSASPEPTPQAEHVRRPHAPLLPSEGIKMTLLEEGLLSGAGVLHGGRTSVESYGLSESSMELFLAIAGAMPEGLNRNRVPKHLAKGLQEHLVPLEIQELVEWMRDARGRQTHMVLSWKGQETLDAARPKKPTSWAARRRAQVRGSSS